VRSPRRVDDAFSGRSLFWSSEGQVGSLAGAKAYAHGPFASAHPVGAAQVSDPQVVG
jgi:hypothetical protein